MIEVFRTISTLPNYEISSFGRIKTKSRPVRYVHAVTQKEHFRTTEERFLKVYDNNRTGYKTIVTWALIILGIILGIVL